MKKDDLMLNEAYNKVINSQTVNEDLGALLKTAGGDVLRGIGGAAKNPAISKIAPEDTVSVVVLGSRFVDRRSEMTSHEPP